ncbi:histidine phosphatase family protein [Cryptosporangium phraense]|uniref:Histidine phosphatase family protein n=1 Tax=Cryptosporangium phraense TaxID=2593070 RepID=A0A545AHQ7_9ACTN|nr:histidine phosphatase family protein [Cryptosporangium phraense]TQS40857.1 histidine phosphatase family protein [Cryptosporangium phraense]
MTAESRPDGVRLTLLTHPATDALATTAFPQDEPLLPAGVRAARDAAGRLAGFRSAAWRCGPALRCRQTVAALGGTGVTIDDGLDECDFGHWRGRTLDELAAADPSGLEAWLTDPDAAPHGGESVRDLLYRATKWLDEVGTGPVRTVAVTHASIVKAVLVVALNAPPSAFWRLDVAPLTRTDLSGRPGAWTVRRTAERLRSDAE